MSIGETLAQARRWSGLSVTEVSQRTRIRETLVKDIERDDYSACGGDFYARGHIRAIARVVGADPEPLIEEYDATHRAPNAQLEDTIPQPVTPGRAHGWPEPPTRPADDLSANVETLIVRCLVSLVKDNDLCLPVVGQAAGDQGKRYLPKVRQLARRACGLDQVECSRPGFPLLETRRTPERGLLIRREGQNLR